MNIKAALILAGAILVSTAIITLALRAPSKHERLCNEWVEWCYPQQEKDGCNQKPSAMNKDDLFILCMGGQWLTKKRPLN